MTTTQRISGIGLASMVTTILALGLGGCVLQGGQGLSLEQTMAAPKFVALAHPTTREIAPRAAAALPPGAGPVVSIRDRRYGDGFRQDILLGDGAVRAVANGITVLAHEPGADGLDPLPFAKPTQASIATELGAQFPGIAMQIVVRHFANAYGPYGVALGHGKDDSRCLYAWQWIDDHDSLARDGMNGPVSVRTRLCRANQTFDDMASLMDGLVLGRNAAGVLQASERSVVAIVEGPDVAPHHVETRPRVAHPKRHRFHARGPRATHRPVVATVETPMEQPMTDGRTATARYMAPIEPRGEPATTQVTADTKLSSDLPTQAYLGPQAGARAVASAPSAPR